MNTGNIDFKLHRVCQLCIKEGKFPKIGEYIRTWTMKQGEKTKFFLLLCKEHFEIMEKVDKENKHIMVPYFYIADNPNRFRQLINVSRGQNDANT